MSKKNGTAVQDPEPATEEPPVAAGGPGAADEDLLAKMREALGRAPDEPGPEVPPPPPATRGRATASRLGRRGLQAAVQLVADREQALRDAIRAPQSRLLAAEAELNDLLREILAEAGEDVPEDARLVFEKDRRTGVPSGVVHWEAAAP